MPKENSDLTQKIKLVSHSKFYPKAHAKSGLFKYHCNLTILYDLLGQSLQNRLEIVIKVIRKNILKCIHYGLIRLWIN